MNEYGNADVLNMELKAKCQTRKPWPRWEEQDKKDLIQKEEYRKILRRKRRAE